MIKKKRKK